MQTVIVLGGGAAGFFGAIACAEARPYHKVLLLEKTNAPLAKVRISGGGRCNVTHACFDPAELIKNYPRGGKALLGPFHRFQPRDTVHWFESRGVALKEEEDGRMFPSTDSSQTIIDCLMKAASEANVQVRLQQKIEKMEKKDGKFRLSMASGESLEAEKLLLATGSSTQGWDFAASLGHTIIPPVPSLFTFNVPGSPLEDLAGISVGEAQLKIGSTPLQQTGPLLITHWGFSGPAALKLSAWGARHLSEKGYEMELVINWLPRMTREALVGELIALKEAQAVIRTPQWNIPRNLWQRLLTKGGIDIEQRWSSLPNKVIYKLADKLQGDVYAVKGKTTYKQEFVTCGGVCLDEVNFKTLESRRCPGLYFAGEVLDIDGVTGGFNFQNAWTTAWIAGHA